MTHLLAAMASNIYGPSETDIGDLEQFCADYPYCHPAHLLLAVALKKYGRDPGGDYERQALAYAVDRQFFLSVLKKHTKPARRFEKPEAPLQKPEAPLQRPEAPLPRPEAFDPGSVITASGPGHSLESQPTASLESETADGPDGGNNHEAPSLSEKQQKQQQIIDRFLEAEPRIVPAKNANYDMDQAREEPTADPDAMSETLAEVLANQGKHGQAIDIYEKLCLKYPEKSSYFAKKIETLKNGSA